MSDAPVSPSDGVEVASAAAEGAESAGAQEAAQGATGAATGDGGGMGLLDALMSTEPRIAPATAKRDLGTDSDAAAHGYIGVRKTIGGLGLAGEDEDGTPAIVHYLAAGWAWLNRDPDADGGTDDDGGDGGALEAVGGGESEEIDADEFRDPAEVTA